MFNNREPAPEFIYVCGAVGSGNSFMYSSLVKDKNIYGINEDAFGTTLKNLLNDENISTCPHSVNEFINFMYKLRKDRMMLLLKTPSNIRYMKLIREYMPNSRFILMIREPHGAIVSGIKRHGKNYSIEEIARIWLKDCEYHYPLEQDSIVITFEQLIIYPEDTLKLVSEKIVPIGPEVYKYASRVNRPERMGSDWWRSKISKDVQKEVEHWVKALDLNEKYNKIIESNKLSRPETDNKSKQPLQISNLSIIKPFVTFKKQLFRFWYRIKR